MFLTLADREPRRADVRADRSLGGRGRRRRCSLPTPPGSTRSAPTAPRPPTAISPPMPTIWDQIRSLHVAESEVERGDRPRARRAPARPAGRHRHRHRPDDRAVRPARARRRSASTARPRCCGWRGSSWRRRASPRACARATCTRCRSPTAAPTASSSTRCSIMPTRPPRRSPRRRGCSRPGGTPAGRRFRRRTSARNCAPRDAHIRLGFEDEAMAGWFAGAGPRRRPCRASEGRRADRDPVARRQAPAQRAAEGGMNRLRPASTAHRAAVRRGARRHRRSASNSSRPRPRRWPRRCGSRSRRSRRCSPRFVSVTYGAGGSTRERTHATVERILKRNRAHAGRASDLRRRQPRRDRRRSRAIIGSSASATSSPCAAIRPSRAAAYRAASRTAIANAAELVAGLKEVAPFDISVAAYPEFHPGFGDRAGRPRQSQAQGRCRRRPRDHPVLLLRRLLLPLPRRGRGGRHRRRDRARASCRSPTSPRPAGSPASAAPRSRTGWTDCSRGSTTCPRRAS